MHLVKVPIGLLAAGAVAIGAAGVTRAQPAASGPPAVGVVEVIKRPITETSEFLGRIEAVNRVNVVARVTAFLEKRLFKEGAEIKAGDELYRLERGPFEADLASKQPLEAQVQSAEAQVQSSKINLDYTDIRSPIDGKIGRTAVTEGNVVSPGSGVLTTIVSQDPMYVVFPVSVRAGLELRDRYATKGGFNAVVIKIRLPDGRLFDQTGKL